MRRGTRVGQAYVAVSADGSGINKDIVDGLDDSHDDIGKSGDRAGEEYGDHFDEGFRSRLKGKMEKVGQALGLKTGTVASRLHRARRRLRESLGGTNPALIVEETPA